MKLSNIFAFEKQLIRQTERHGMAAKKEYSVERTGVAQVKSRQLDCEVPKSEIIIGGVDLLKD